MSTRQPLRPLFGVQRRRRSRVGFLLAVLLTAGIATGIAVYLDDGDSAPDPAQAAEIPSAVAAATPAGQDDVITPAQGTDEPSGARAVAEADSEVGAAQTTIEAPAESDDSEPATADGSAAATDEASAQATPAEDEQPAAVVPVPPSVTVTPGTVPQGRATLVVLSGDIDADRVFVSIDGYTGEMVSEEGVGWVGFVPVSPLAAARRYNVVVDTFKDDVYQTTLLGELFVEETVREIEQITLDPETAALLAPELVAIDNQTRFEQYVEPSGPRLWTLPWHLPLLGETTGDFGVLRSYNGGPPNDWHHGLDITADAGTPIVAPAPGRVVFATELPVHGLGVILDHGAGVYSGYWHMSAIEASVGDLVQSGQTLGLVGETGVVTGPHLHWEVIVQGQDIDPIQWTEAAFR